MMLKRKALLSLLLSFAVLLSLSQIGYSETRYHRVSWDSDPSSSAVIGFSPNGNSFNPYIRYGTSTNEGSWQAKYPDHSPLFGGLQSHFVRLRNLPANSGVYYRVCDQDGCGDRLWFRTAPTDQSPFTFIAGGDTLALGVSTREGNRVVSRIRPLFVMHGGDFTKNNNTSQMKTYLDLWGYTYSKDTINGLAYKRVYPIIPAQGNHEGSYFRTMCEVFGLDPNQNNICEDSDSYSAFNISPLLRVYTLNSEFQKDASRFATMNAWLRSDLQHNRHSATWAVAQYHKPMFPHTRSKPDNPKLFNEWARPFYDNAMNLVIESDSHITKVTYPVRPSGSSFKSKNDGTVYVGEGSWGVNRRAANDSKSYTLDMDDINQFKVVSVLPDRLRVRTARFSGTESTLTWQQRANDPLVLPSGIRWWTMKHLGDIMTLVQSDRNLSMIDKGSRISKSVDNSAGDAEERISDGHISIHSSDLEMVNDSQNRGDQIVGVQFSGLNIPQGAVIKTAYLEFVTDESNRRDTRLTIRAEDTDSASQFAFNTRNISNRTLTLSSVDWQVPHWNSKGKRRWTPELAPLVQDIINRPGWRKNNNIAFIIKGYGKRVAESYDGDAAPKLVIRYDNLKSSVNTGKQNIVTMRKGNATGYGIDGNNGAILGQQVFLWDYSDTNINQQWLEVSRDNGFVSFQKYNTNLCIDGGNGGWFGQAVVLQKCGSHNHNQHWKKVNLGGGKYRLEKRNAPSFSIDGNNGAGNGQGLHLWGSNNGNSNQHWYMSIL